MKAAKEQHCCYFILCCCFVFHCCTGFQSEQQEVTGTLPGGKCAYCVPGLLSQVSSGVVKAHTGFSGQLQCVRARRIWVWLKRARAETQRSYIWKTVKGNTSFTNTFKRARACVLSACSVRVEGQDSGAVQPAVCEASVSLCSPALRVTSVLNLGEQTCIDGDQGKTCSERNDAY